MGIIMSRPPKKPEDKKTANMKLPMTEAEKTLIEQAAAVDGEKPVTWARNAILRVAKRKAKTA